jgi:uncharacterized protein YndB with AHSA1/START domain
MTVAVTYRSVDVAVAPPYEAVEVALHAPVPAWDAWRAISEPPQVRRWLGTLWSQLAPGTSTRLDFGDGDFFELDVVRVEPPRTLELAWRFLGIAPVARVTWTVESLEEFACVVRVRDHEDGRGREETLALASGWVDFLERLARFLETGGWARYAWRKEADVAIELAVPLRDARRLLADELSAWLPGAPAALEPGAELAVLDDAPLAVRGIRRRPDALDVDLARPGWERATRCAILVRGRAAGSLLEVHHVGFGETPLDDGPARRLRARAVRTWIEALRRARVSVCDSPTEGS